MSKTNESYLFTIQTRRPVLLCCLLIEQTISIKPREELNSNIHISKKCSRWKKLTHAWPYIRYSSCISILYIVTTKNEIHELKERLKYRVFSTMINLSFDMNMNTNTNPPLVHAMALNDKRRFLSQMKYHKKVCEWDKNVLCMKRIKTFIGRQNKISVWYFINC